MKGGSANGEIQREEEEEGGTSSNWREGRREGRKEGRRRGERGRSIYNEREWGSGERDGEVRRSEKEKKKSKQCFYRRDSKKSGRRHQTNGPETKCKPGPPPKKCHSRQSADAGVCRVDEAAKGQMSTHTKEWSVQWCKQSSKVQPLSCTLKQSVRGPFFFSGCCTKGLY